ncbi:MAG: hypothetical protein J5X23_11055 [Candidatus Accumulibacter sp.]|uniref:hypothetical protein n=1 Tax=Accumulibacter sp. TaxID=2053492 RepID=UPI001B2B432E|nr:hypothetical protein [Accumulibacter sp.]MBO3715497.1 hypothetical protein [Accumulibacter sp.]
MGIVENIERQIQELSANELAEFRLWFAEFDAQLWDRQLESDVRSGKLDTLANDALRAHAAGQTTKL